MRVCAPGGKVLPTEFYWRRPPTAEARQIFLGDVCPGMQFDSAEEWKASYRAAGLDRVEISTGPFATMTPGGLLHDEGLLNALAICGRTLSRREHRRKMVRLMPCMARAIPYLGHIVVTGIKPIESPTS